MYVALLKELFNFHVLAISVATCTLKEIEDFFIAGDSSKCRHKTHPDESGERHKVLEQQQDSKCHSVVRIHPVLVCALFALL